MAVPTMSEDSLLAAVIALAHARHWLAFHPLPARLGDRWVTATMGDRGYLDLTLARNGVVLHRELKADRGSTTMDQRAWLAACGLDIHTGVWRPRDWHSGRIERELR